MRKRKKILKIFFISMALLQVVLFIDLLSAKIKSTDDISNLKRITIYDQKGAEIYTIRNLHEASWISYEELPSLLIDAFVELEDRNFFRHQGFDIYRIGNAILHNISHKQKIGGSTITQQYVKNLYLNNQKSYLRKAKELYYAIQLERIYSKEQILEGYLNTIYFNHGIYGVNDAARFYFNKVPKELTLAEIASLVTIIKSPTSYSPITNFTQHKARQKVVLNTLLKRKTITTMQYEQAYLESLKLYGKKPQDYDSTVMFFKDYVLYELQQFQSLPKKGHIHIHTSFDQSVNKTIEQFIKNYETDAEVSAVVLNAQGQLVSLVGGKNYYQSTYNIATQSTRMIGSTIKPILYYEALNHGMSPLSTFQSQPTNFFIDNEPYKIQNYNNQYENRPITMAYAIATSDNIYAMKTHLFLGSSVLMERLKKLGIKNAENYPSLALGSLDLSLLQLTSVYNSFSTLGMSYRPHAITKITTDHNKLKYQYLEKPKRVFRQSASYIISELLTGVFDQNMSHNISVTGASVANQLHHRVAGKTGLTDYDSYFVGYNPLYTIGVWTGHLENELLVNQHEKKLPKELFVSIFNDLMKENEDIWYKQPKEVYSRFVDPTGFQTGYKKQLYFMK